MNTSTNTNTTATNYIEENKAACRIVAGAFAYFLNDLADKGEAGLDMVSDPESAVLIEALEEVLPGKPSDFMRRLFITFAAGYKAGIDFALKLDEVKADEE